MRKSRFADYENEPIVDFDDPAALTSIPPTPKEKIQKKLFESEPVKPARERQTERFQFTVKPSTKAALAKYAADHDVTMNNLVLSLIEEFLEREGYTNT